MNAVLENITKRCSCRAYTGEPLSETETRALGKAAAAAPSAMNRQPWRVIIVNSPALMAELEAEALKSLSADKAAYDRIMGRGGKVFYNAPCMVLVAVDRSNSFAMTDCGILCENVALAAASMGLGSVICGMAGLIFANEPERFKTRLGIPEGFEFGLAVLVGKSAGEFTPHEPDMSKISFVN